MKTEISRDSYQSEKRYSGVYQQQGRMLTDADWNELVEILKSRLNEALRGVVGSQQGSIGGTPRHRGLRIVNDSGIKIQPGHIYIDGMAARLPESDPFAFDQQVDFPNPPPPTGDYVLYADVWERSITHIMDEGLLDPGLHGADTCTRKQILAQVKWCPDSIDPERSSKNPAKGDAGLTLTLLQKMTDPDACDPCAAELDIDSSIGNYLFRVEVHNVEGDADNPSEITLKWSSENGAEQFQALTNEDAMPAGFISDKWAYEFFDATSGRHVGVHLNSTAWQPARLGLVIFNEISGAYTVPSIPGSSEATTLVRRWDGYCRIDLNSGVLLEGIDRGVELDTGKAVDSLGFVDIGSTLKMVLNSLSIELEMTSKSFVAGDFWLADVREAVHSEGSQLLIGRPPQGIQHYYLTLGQVTAGVLQENAEIDRKYAFPPLTQMTRLFMAGGDGQEIVPGEPLPQPLRVGVANGEWPVTGATVRFEIEDAPGSLNVANAGLTDARGIAECEWTPDAVIGATCRVKATLVNPDNPADATSDLSPPVYFYANLISADQIAYAPACQPETNEASVHHLLLGPDDSRLGDDGYYTVKEVLDALLCELKAEHVPYDPDDQGARWDDINESGDRPTTVQRAIDDLAENLESTDIRYEVPDCSTSPTPTVRSGLAMTAGATVKVDEVLDKLLCEFNADDLPLDRSASLCSGLAADSSVETVQDALNYLCDHLGGISCAITVGAGGQFESLEEALDALAGSKEICICLLPGDHPIKNSTKLRGKMTIRISGCGAEVSRIFILDRLLLGATEIQLRDVSIIGGEKPGVSTTRGSLILSGMKASHSHFIVENCIFNRVFRGPQSDWLPSVIIEGDVKLDWHKNQMNAMRRDELVAAAVTPDMAGLNGKALAAAGALELAWASDPYSENALYEERVKAAAEAIVNLSAPQRRKMFNARDVDSINNLPREMVDIRRLDRVVSSATGIDASAPTADHTPALRMAFSVSPQAEVVALFEDIRGITAANINDLIDRIKAVTSLVTSFDYALALTSNSVGGSITQNVVRGNLALHFSQQNVQPIRWPSVDSPEQVELKEAIAGGFINAKWPIQQQLHIQQNSLNEVHSMLEPKKMKIIRDGLKGNLADNFELPGYESAFICDNVFEGDKNSFIGRFINLKDNHFLYQNNKGAILAYLLGYRGFISGNHSHMEGDNDDYIIDQMLSRHLPGGFSNFLNIV